MIVSNFHPSLAKASNPPYLTQLRTKPKKQIKKSNAYAALFRNMDFKMDGILIFAELRVANILVFIVFMSKFFVSLSSDMLSALRHSQNSLIRLLRYLRSARCSVAYGASL